MYIIDPYNRVVSHEICLIHDVLMYSSLALVLFGILIFNENSLDESRSIVHVLPNCTRNHRIIPIHAVA